MNSPLPGKRSKNIDANTLIPVRFSDSNIMDQHRRAAKVVAALSINIDDCIELLEMLGLDARQDDALTDSSAGSSCHPTPRLRQPGRATRALR